MNLSLCIYLAFAFVVILRSFAFKFRMELICFSAMLEYQLYTPLASKLHFVPCINLLCKIIAKLGERIALYIKNRSHFQKMKKISVLKVTRHFYKSRTAYAVLFYCHKYNQNYSAPPIYKLFFAFS